MDYTDQKCLLCLSQASEKFCIVLENIFTNKYNLMIIEALNEVFGRKVSGSLILKLKASVNCTSGILIEML